MKKKSGSKILIIDDDPQINLMVGDFLQRHGNRVVCAADGEKGLSLALAELPDLILCDLNMPVLDGRAVVSRLRQSEQLNDIPVIFLSASTDRAQIRESINLGGDDFLAKPAALHEILDAVNARLLRAKKQRTRLELQFNKKAAHLSGSAVKKRLVTELNQPGNESKADGEGNSEDHPRPAKLSIQQARGGNQQTEAKLFLAGNPNRRELVHLSDVKLVKAFGEYSKIFWGVNQTMMARKSLKLWEKELPDCLFVRIHRQTIINLAFFKFLEKTSDRKLLVHLRGFDAPFLVSQRGTPVLNRRLRAFQPG